MKNFRRLLAVVALVATLFTCTPAYLSAQQGNVPGQFPPTGAAGGNFGPFIGGRSYSSNGFLGPYFESPMVYQPTDPLSPQFVGGNSASTTSGSGLGSQNPNPNAVGAAVAALFVSWTRGVLYPHGQAVFIGPPVSTNSITNAQSIAFSIPSIAVTASQNDCSSPSFLACNFVFATQLCGGTATASGTVLPPAEFPQCQVAGIMLNGTFTGSTTGGTIATGNVRVRSTLVGKYGGETLASVDSGTQALTGPTASFTVAPPTLGDVAATDAAFWNLYVTPTINGAANTEVLAASNIPLTGTGSTVTITALPTSTNAALPTTNTAYKVQNTVTLATARGVGNVLLAYVKTTATTVSSVVYTYQFTPADPSGLGSFNDGTLWISGPSCSYSTPTSVAQTSAELMPAAATTYGHQAIGASLVPSLQISTTAAAQTSTYTCVIPNPSRLATNKGAIIQDVVWVYGVQQNALGTQVAGNFTAGTITLPTPGAAETASTVTPVAAGGTITLTPVVGSFNTATTTAGAFFTEKMAFGTPISMTTDNQILIVNAGFVNNSAVTTLNLLGVLVHFQIII